LSHSREQRTTKLPAIESTGTKRDANGQPLIKCQKAPWGDSKDNKEQPAETIHFPRICKRWSPTPGAGPKFRISDDDSRGSCPGLVINTNNTSYDSLNRLSSHVSKTSVISRQNRTPSASVIKGPAPNPVLLPINFTDLPGGSEKRVRVKTKRHKLNMGETEEGNNFPTFTAHNPTNPAESR
uniref:Breast cancer 1 n=1 Tax=Echinostoma caproni TaxID=27848 RepID=A0A183APL7_9TREM